MSALLAAAGVALALGEGSDGLVAAVFGVTALAGIGAVVSGQRLARYVDDLEQSHTKFRTALGRLGEALGASDDRAALLAVVLETTQSLVGADAAVFWADNGPAVVARAQRGTDVAGRRVELGEGLAGWVAATGEAARWPPAARAPAAAEPPAGTAIAVPVNARGRRFGVLALYRREGATPFSQEELDDVAGIARQAEPAIDTTYLLEDTRRMSLTDGLTGLWNRRQFELRVAQELERATRFGEHFSLVLLDLDGFKGINDTYGHLTGDTVLVETARRLAEHTREVDLVARFGGEEFVLLLPQTELDGALRVAEKVRQEVAATPVDGDAGPVPMTISAGVACHPEHGATLKELLGAADEALYEAKGAGKNRVVHAPSRPSSTSTTP